MRPPSPSPKLRVPIPEPHAPIPESRAPSAALAPRRLGPAVMRSLHPASSGCSAFVTPCPRARRPVHPALCLLGALPCPALAIPPESASALSPLMSPRRFVRR
ncbi:hypothetical protein C8R44DRAFT_988239 [Mycena epipterygia]|nr:hypothetical protein C8R44DRAFT_988239 [Mycena epipterygia]